MNQHWESCKCEGTEFKSIDEIIDPVHKHPDETWWWLDETWADEFGPFATYKEALDSVIRYAKDCLGV